MTNLNKQSCKPWKSIKQQIQILESRGMTFEDKVQAEHVLSRVNYYRLSGYWYPFRQFESNAKRYDEFVENTKFSDVWRIYLFDKKLRILCLQALEIIEMSLRTTMAYTTGRISPTFHLNKHNFNERFVKGEHEHYSYDRWLKRYNTQINRAHKVPFIKHHFDNYHALPIWVGIEVLDFGSLSVLYAGLKGKQQRHIAESYRIDNAKNFESWLKSFNYIRNICAHHARLWNVNIDVIAKVDKSIQGLEFTDNTRIFYYLILLKYFLKTIGTESDWSTNMKNLLEKFPIPENNAINLYDLGFTNWKDWHSQGK